MSVVITNVSNLAEDSEYTVRINDGPVIARFQHKRSDGLAVCLEKASASVAEAVGHSSSHPTDILTTRTR